MIETDLYQLFKIHLPIALKGEYWNGEPGEYSNIGCDLNYSQQFGLTPYAKTGVYGKLADGRIIKHFGHDFAGFENTPLVFPYRSWLSYIGFEKDGYGNFCFFETEPISVNGETVKMEFVLAHMAEKPALSPYHWYEAGKFIGRMGSTGMSSGIHTHFGGRPLIKKADGSWEWLVNDPTTRGYIDLEPILIEKPVYDKQILINLNKTIMDNEKKIIIEGEGKGRKGVIVNGKLREIKDGREADACLYVLANNGMGQTIKTDLFDKLPKDINF